ncbi:hypothetical protein JW752_00735 [Candidatus Peregrinibacteria bacterium]|nr:hypothetical protein [Candidatus Peregrinibacteria bacterium]
MKKLFLIIGILLTFTLNSVRAEEPESAVLKKCKSQLPSYPKVIELDPNTHLQFRLEFERVRTQYHEYMNCVFEEATVDILGEDPKALLQPETACQSEKKLVDVLKNSSPETLLEPLLKAYHDYADYLNRLVIQVSANSESNVTTMRDFDLAFQRIQQLRVLVEDEIQNGIVALDAAFQTLKQMRQAYVMHVHFQCMLKNLETYRQIMGHLREVVTIIPNVIIDCSMHK